MVQVQHLISNIDDNKEKVESLIEKYDVSGVVGNGACIDIQKEANVGPAFEEVGPYASFAGYSEFSKTVLTIYNVT